VSAHRAITSPITALRFVLTIVPEIALLKHARESWRAPLCGR
jgi:hypothetical protein